jgi:predicted nucleotidyltransferase
MVDAAILKSVERYIQALRQEGIKVRFAVIFGSYVSGKANELSDIDLLVICSEFDGMIPRKYVKKLWQIAARIDSRIEPIPCGENQWYNDVSNAIIEIARIEGQKVAAA